MYFKFKEHVVSITGLYNSMYTCWILHQWLSMYSVGSTYFSKFKFKCCVALVVNPKRVTSVTYISKLTQLRPLFNLLTSTYSMNE